MTQAGLGDNALYLSISRVIVGLFSSRLRLKRVDNRHARQSALHAGEHTPRGVTDSQNPEIAVIFDSENCPFQRDKLLQR